MSVDTTARPDLAAPDPAPQVVTDPEGLREKCRVAEDKVLNLERALESNRRIGIAIGVLMWQRRVTDVQAFELLKVHSQHAHVKLRQVAEDVILTGTL